MKKKQIFLISFFFVIVGVLISAVYYAATALPIANGYNAKILCSAVFVSKRDKEKVISEDLSSFNYVDKSVDISAKTVTASVFGLFPRTAVYREKLGCTLISGESSPESLKSQYQSNLLSEVKNVKRIDLEFSKASNINKKLLESTINEAFLENKQGKKNTRAIIALYKGKIIAEKYAESISKETPLLGWSMTKSVLNAMTGIMIKKVNLKLDENNLFSEWANDKRKEIKLDQLLRMSSGLKFEEDYSKVSDATNMLFRSYDISTIPLKKNLETEPDSKWYYSSGTTNLISKLIHNKLADEKTYLSFPYKEIFAKLGMDSAIIETDPSGNFVMSSFMYANARDWAKFGQLYLQDGIWNDEKIFPDNWVKSSSTPTPKAEKGKYGAQFWLNAGNQDGKNWVSLPNDIFYMSGFESQYVLIIPSKDLVIVRLGQTKKESDFDEEKMIKGIIDSISE